MYKLDYTDEAQQHIAQLKRKEPKAFQSILKGDGAATSLRSTVWYIVYSRQRFLSLC